MKTAEVNIPRDHALAARCKKEITKALKGQEPQNPGELIHHVATKIPEASELAIVQALWTLFSEKKLVFTRGWKIALATSGTIARAS